MFLTTIEKKTKVIKSPGTTTCKGSYKCVNSRCPSLGFLDLSNLHLMANIITSVSSQRWWESEKPAQRIFRVAHQSSGVNWKFTWTIPALSPWRRHQRELRSQEQYLGANPWGNIPAVSDSLPHCIFKFSYKSWARGNWASGIERLPKHTAWPLPDEKDSFSGCVKGLQKAISTGGDWF